MLVLEKRISGHAAELKIFFFCRSRSRILLLVFRLDITTVVLMVESAGVAPMWMSARKSWNSPAAVMPIRFLALKPIVELARLRVNERARRPGSAPLVLSVIAGAAT
jgi:hypothetical protein